MVFKDYFSSRAELYARYRPTYPDELFAWVASLVQRHEVVWDCATGSGQAAVGLAEYFSHVIATDASAKQIAMADPHEKISYRVATADNSGLGGRSVDAVTVAQAIHWFDHQSFYDEVRRVLRSDGVIAIWAHGDPVIDDPAVNRIVHEYNRGTIEKYWKPERDLILQGLRTIAFPFREVTAPDFVLRREWTLEQLAGNMRTWSGTAAYASVLGADPIISVEASLASVWESGSRMIRWPLYVRAGYLN